MGNALGLMYSGLSGSSIQLSDFSVRPGAGSGLDIDGQTHPALPCEQPPPRVPDSTMTGSAPIFFRYQAVERPMTPPPTTPTRIRRARSGASSLRAPAQPRHPHHPHIRHQPPGLYPGPRTIRPGFAPVCSPPLSTRTPFTNTSSTPTES